MVLWLGGYGPSMLQSDLASSYFHLFGPLQKHLAGKHFATKANMKQPVTFWLQTLNPYFFYTSIQALVPRWDKCLDVNSDYVEVCCVHGTIMCHIYAHLPTCSVEQSPS